MQKGGLVDNVQKQKKGNDLSAVRARVLVSASGLLYNCWCQILVNLYLTCIWVQST